jgi:stage V sporulation protein SpoVS
LIYQAAAFLKISKGSNPGAVAGAIASRLREKQPVGLLAIGADCVALAMKAAAMARRFVAEDRFDIAVRPSFTSVTFEDERNCSAVQMVAVPLPV